MFSLNRAEQCLDNLDAGGSRVGFQNEAIRVLGRARAELEYGTLGDLEAELPDQMERLQETCAVATDAVVAAVLLRRRGACVDGGPLMQIRLSHTTRITYADKADASYYLARMAPRSDREQLVVSTRLEVSPAPYSTAYRDYFGTTVTAFEVLDPHEELTVTAVATVHVLRGEPAAPVLGWADLAAREVADGYAEYLTVPDALEVPADLAARVVELREDTPGATAAAVCRLVHEQVEHVAVTPSRASGSPRPGSAGRARPRTSRDLTIAALRGFGLPARYVGGYRHPDPSAAVGEELASAPHAWVEWWDDGWRAHDPAYGCEVADAHVVVGVGRDHGDVRPLSGVCAGASGVERSVEVRMTRLG